MVKKVGIALGGLALAATMATASPILYERAKDGHPTKRNIVLGWTDGMGQNVVGMTRHVIERLRNPEGGPSYTGYETTLENDSIGVMRCGSASSFITDSAAAGTAVATGQKTNNGIVGVSPDGKPLGNILEAAKEAGYLTGIITTSYVWDASPAAFTAHSEDRDDAWFIAEQQIGMTHPLGRVADVILGGGRCAFIPQSEEDSCRFDDKDLIKLAQEKYGWNVVQSPEALKSAQQLPLLGLFAPEDFAAPLDRVDSQPTLEAMVDKAIELLSAATEDNDDYKGFFLFYESEVTDTTGHNNDAIASYSAALEINDATLKVKEWYGKLKARGEDTLFFSLSDHETGGFSIGFDVEDPPTEVEYGWEPLVIGRAVHSPAYTADLVAEVAGSGNASLAQAKSIVAENLKLQNYTETEAQMVVAAGNDTSSLLEALVYSVNIRARVGFTTGGHTANDVQIFCYENPYCMKFWGSHENTDLHKIMSGFLNDDSVDISKVTSKLSGLNPLAPTLEGEPVEARRLR